MSGARPFDSAPLSVTALSRIIAGLLSVSDLHDIWITGELVDLRASGGHCYMELVDKDAASGRVNARIKAIMWANIAPGIGAKFQRGTGQRLQSGLKVMVCGTVNYHPSFGISVVITDINPSYTLGEAERRRREILERLKADGVIDINRSLPWPVPVLRIAVVSAPGAAGYGDFVNQLYSTPRRIRFSVELFTAVMQGVRTAESCIAALDAIGQRADEFDCVVMIRGGGSSSDLQSFDDYALAANVAQFPLPVIVGIGHERDVTVLDYVAAMRVKTPTAAAEWLIARAGECLDRLRQAAADILAAATDRMAGCNTQLSYCEGMLPTAARAVVQRACAALDNARLSLAGVRASRIVPEQSRLVATGDALKVASRSLVSRAMERLDASSELLRALSPEATLRRGFSVTRTMSGHTITSAAEAAVGTTIVTTFADGEVTSTVTNHQ